ncbi:Methyltransferase-like protein 6 [Oopsacas minuta]|uniref:tRNA N(3)-methylcytidine methyltransferase n=1 Tax=Oopsacas minuta TaxID=111878 RepID=A0AAV7JKR9_9METZ|nr:Methyltransferase-like protein 6 [Oopsacas minuta]
MAERYESRNVVSDKEIERVDQDKCISSYKREKIEKESKKHWDLFYKRNSTNFFKDRHWCGREFPELLRTSVTEIDSSHEVTLLECGCGVGNLMFPLIQENSSLFVYACDISHVAVELVQKNEAYIDTKCNAFQCDLTVAGSLKKHIKEKVTMATLVFVLSAISPDKMSTVVQNISGVLAPGGKILFRDYGVFDHAMMQFGQGHKIDTNYYFRQDWTRVYYFSLEDTEKIFTSNGFEVCENKFVKRKTINVKEGVDVDRIFVQGKFTLLS